LTATLKQKRLIAAITGHRVERHGDHGTQPDRPRGNRIRKCHESQSRPTTTKQVMTFWLLSVNVRIICKKASQIVVCCFFVDHWIRSNETSIRTRLNTLIIMTSSKALARLCLDTGNTRWKNMHSTTTTKETHRHSHHVGMVSVCLHARVSESWKYKTCTPMTKLLHPVHVAVLFDLHTLKEKVNGEQTPRSINICLPDRSRAARQNTAQLLASRSFVRCCVLFENTIWGCRL
jgi:hypothetical protein